MLIGVFFPGKLIKKGLRGLFGWRWRRKWEKDQIVCSFSDKRRAIRAQLAAFMVNWCWFTCIRKHTHRRSLKLYIAYTIGRFVVGVHCFSFPPHVSFFRSHNTFPFFEYVFFSIVTRGGMWMVCVYVWLYVQTCLYFICIIWFCKK